MGGALSTIYGYNPLLPGGSGSTLLTAGIGDNSLLASVPPVYTWPYVRPRFTQFLDNLRLTYGQVEDGQTKLRGVVSALNRRYWNSSDGSANSQLIGSWAKHTRVRPPRDIDVNFILPIEVYYRFEQRQGNRQSQLLQELRDVLRATYPLTDIGGDRHVVVVPFTTYKIEIAPVFHRQGGGYLVCDSSGAGSYKHADPAAELAALSTLDTQYNGNVRKLTRMLKQWQRECGVPIKSFQIEAAIKGALANLSHAGNDEFWFDWLVRDVFEHLTECGNGSFQMPGTGELIHVGDAWLSRAQTAYLRAAKACDYERDNENYLAGQEWQKIFGTLIPQTV